MKRPYLLPCLLIVFLSPLFIIMIGLTTIWFVFFLNRELEQAERGEDEARLFLTTYFPGPNDG